MHIIKPITPDIYIYQIFLTINLGKPLLANDPHLDNVLPSMWYQAEIIYGENYENYIIGANMATIPSIVVGINKFHIYN